MSSLYYAVRTGWAAFRDAMVNADPQQQQQGGLGEFDAFSIWQGRQTRYDLFWSMWQSNFFRDRAHYWAPAVKDSYGLYKYTRNVFNPVNRLVEFHVAHTMGGRLDPEAGDGESARSALPILTENDAIRKPIAQLWRDERWQQNKAIFSRFGSCLGDAAVIVDDDPVRGRVTRRVIHPGHLKWVEQDTAGHVTAYIVEKWRYDPRAMPVSDLNPTSDPRGTRIMVKYNEEGFVRGGKVVFRTYLNGSLFDWRKYSNDGAEMPPEWECPYPFVPMVLVQHVNVGLPWGVAEPHALISKALEVDDMASGLGDQIRKRIRAPKLLAGVKGPGGPPFGKKGEDDGVQASWTQKGREEVPFLYGPENASVHDLTNDLDVPGVSSHVQSIVSEMERDYPELQMDLWATGDPSGRALRVARQRTENKVQERRSGYDAAMVMSHKMALAIGARRGYPGYEGLDFDPFEPGPLDHEIAHRPVFSPDPLDDIEEGNAFWTMVNAAVTAGMPLEVVLKREGWGDDEIDEVLKTKAANAVDAVKQAQAMTAATTVVTPGGPAAKPEPQPEKADA